MFSRKSGIAPGYRFHNHPEMGPRWFLPGDFPRYSSPPVISHRWSPPVIFPRWFPPGYLDFALYFHKADPCIFGGWRAPLCWIGFHWYYSYDCSAGIILTHSILAWKLFFLAICIDWECFCLATLKRRYINLRNEWWMTANNHRLVISLLPLTEIAHCFQRFLTWP